MPNSNRVTSLLTFDSPFLEQPYELEELPVVPEEPIPTFESIRVKNVDFWDVETQTNIQGPEIGTQTNKYDYTDYDITEEELERSVFEKSSRD